MTSFARSALRSARLISCSCAFCRSECHNRVMVRAENLAFRYFGHGVDECTSGRFTDIETLLCAG